MKNVKELARTMANQCPAMRARQMSRILSSIFDAELRPLGLQVSQLPLLLATAILGDLGIPLGALARALVMDPTTLTRKVRPLEKVGYVRMARDPADARTRLVILTREGERIVESAYPLWQRALAKAEATYGARRLAGLRAEMTPIVAAVGGFTGAAAAKRPRTSRGPRG